MDFNATETIARQHIEQLHHEAAVRRRLRGDTAARRSRHGVACSSRSARSVRSVREAIGYRLVVLGWRLLDGSPLVADRPAS
jgi:hypothetical protein